MLWYSARSLPLPAYSVVATLNCVTCLPDARARISGSRVRRPARRTLFTVHRSFIGRPTGHGPTLRAAGCDLSGVAPAYGRRLIADLFPAFQSEPGRWRDMKFNRVRTSRFGPSAPTTIEPGAFGTYRPLPLVGG